MTPSEIDLVRRTWRQVVPVADQASALFYERLFEIDPKLRPYFDGVDMAAQHQKQVRALSQFVHGLGDIEAILPELEALGRRHVGYGVRDQDYETVGEALLWTLERGLGDDWTAETEAAWTAAYGLIAEVMRRAAADDGKPRVGALAC